MEKIWTVLKKDKKNKERDLEHVAREELHRAVDAVEHPEDQKDHRDVKTDMGQNPFHLCHPSLSAGISASFGVSASTGVSAM